MNFHGIKTLTLPPLRSPVLIAGFEGWGNAANISIKMAGYLIGKFKANLFAELDPDLFYRYDGPRPVVDIEHGHLIEFTPPSGFFYHAQVLAGERDLVILKADEPNINWYHFANVFFQLCLQLNVTLIITLGSMFDRVLHTDRTVSGIATDSNIFERLQTIQINPISYRGPSAIHSIIQYEGMQRDLDCISLWSHCPFYLQSSHYGILAHLGKILSLLGGFDLDVSDLEKKWKHQHKQFQALIDKHPELQEAIQELQQLSPQETPQTIDKSTHNSPNIINFMDFLDPK